MANDILAKMAVLVSAQTQDFDKKMQQSSKGLNTFQKTFSGFSKGAQTFGNNLNIAGQNVGGLASKLTSLLNPATAAAGVIGTLGAAYLTTFQGAEDLEKAQFRLQSSFQLLGREVAGFVDIIKNGFTEENTSETISFFNLLTSLANPALLSAYILKVDDEAAALANLKDVYDDLLRTRLIESQEISELERQIEKLKTQRVEENVSIKDKIALDRQILKLEEQRFLFLVSNAESRRQSLEAEADKIANITGAMTDQQREQRINNRLTDEQLELLINTRNEVKNLEAEYSLRVRKIRKELTGLLEDLNSTGSFLFDRTKLKATGDISFPGEQDNAFDSETSDKQLASIVAQAEAVLGLGDAYNNLNFNLAQYLIDQENAKIAAEESANKMLELGNIVGQLSQQIIEGGDTVAERQENQVRAIGNATIDIVDLYFKQSMAAAIAGALKIGGPAGLAIAGASIAAVRALFNKAVGRSFGGGGGAGAVSRAPRPSISGNVQDSMTIIVEGQLKGNDILISNKKTTRTNGSTRVSG